MKKVLSIVFMVMAIMSAMPANAQVNFGVKGGLNVMNMSFSNDVFDASNKNGFFVGPMVKITVPIIGLSFDAAALYDQKEAEVSYFYPQGDDVFSYAETKMTQKSINIPVNIRYGWGFSSLANVFLFAGPQWGFNVGDKTFKWTDSNSYTLKKSNFSVNVGAGITLLKHLQVTANYNIACGKTADAETKVGVVNIVDQAGKSRNNSWQIALGYWF